MSKKTLDVKVRGVPVRVHSDAEGQPLYAIAGLQRPDDHEHERLIALAATVAFDVTCASAERQRETTAAWNESARVRVEASTEHPANAWLALAYAEHPEHGRKKLAHAAGCLAVAAKVDPKERDEITEDRARRFLERQRNSGGQDENRG